MAASDIGIDLGTSSVVVQVAGKGIVLKEPTVVAYDKDTEKIIGIGEEAKQLVGKTGGNVNAIYPIRQGVIVDYEVAEKMLKYFISKAIGRRAFRKPRITICVPSGITAVEKKAVEEVTYQAGAREVYLIEEPIAAAIGSGMEVLRPCGNMVVDIGGGTTDIAVISLGGIVVSASIKVGGDDFDKAIMQYVRKNHNLFIGEMTAETVKIKIGTVFQRPNTATMEVNGRNVVTGLPKVVVLTSEEVREALQQHTTQIVDTVHQVLEKTPPELAADIVERGIVLTGGGALLEGMEELIEQKTGINTMTAEKPMLAVAEGAGAYAELSDQIE